MTENKRFTYKYDMTKCKDYGLKCPYWNKWSNYCTKFKIWSDSE